MLANILKSLSASGDPLADAVVVDYQDASPEVRALLMQGLNGGVLAVRGMPQSFQALLEDAEQALFSMPAAEIEAALEPYLWIDPIWLSISLGSGSLAHTYSDPEIASVLMRTGNLVGQAVARRLLETQLWRISVLWPGGLSLGGDGYVQTVQVRLLHARVRAKLTREGWRDSSGRPAVPIDQLQMLRTWLDFTVVPFDALERSGFVLGDDQKNRMYAVWRLIGRLLGIDSRLLSAVTDHDKAQELLALVDSEISAPDNNSRALVTAMLDALGNRLAPALGLPADVSVMLMASLCRLFHGDEMASSLGIEQNWTSSLLPVMVDANQFRFTRILSDPQYRATEKQKSLDAFAAIKSATAGSEFHWSG